ncbi:MAG: Aminoglycoside phosphotransferase [Gammaproteobacteria bacterium]|nr:Aminoglycoside phosphotransferase [Gammaproteobacteria bacterium]
MPETDARLALLKDWLSRDLGLHPARVEPASADASFRRYFRAFHNGSTFIVMDAPPGKEDVRPYLKVTRLLEALGAHVPHVHEADIARGLLLLEDLGGTHYLSRLNAGDDPERLYGDALRVLADIQVRGEEAAAELPPYDREVLGRELALLPEWFLGKHLALELSTADTQMIAAAFEFLIGEALAQPAVFVHRDYHSRNLMVVDDRPPGAPSGSARHSGPYPGNGGNPGVLDFQDALRGPIGYDLASLLKDCYISWPRERVVGWVNGYRTLLRSKGGEAAGRLGGHDNAEFLRWFDLIGVQRHIKVLGIFARLWYRDGKAGYLNDLPLTLDYVRDTCARYTELGDLAQFLEQRVVPELPRANARVAARATA